MKAIVGLVKPVEGSISICGKNPLTDIDAKNCIGYVAEDPILIGSLTTREHIEFAATIRRVGKESEEWINYLIKAFDFTLNLDKPVYTLSRGNKQKASLKLALTHKPKILMLDEPFTSLDFQSSSILKTS